MQIRSWIMACALATMLAPVARVEAQSAAGQEKANHIAAALKESGQLSGYRVGVQYEDGVAWLFGTVTDEQQMQTALELAQQVDGVQHVVNKLEIVPAEDKDNSRPAAGARESEPSLLLTTLDTPAEQPAPSRVAAARPAAQPARVPAQAQRSSMPMPMNPAQAAAVRQASFAAGNVQQASGAPGCGPGGMGHGGMGHGMVPGASGYVPGATGGVAHDNAQMPGYAWPSYAAYPNYAALTYPQQYSPTAWPYIGPFYPYPQVPLGWRRVTLEWDDGWWWLDFSHRKGH